MGWPTKAAAKEYKESWYAKNREKVLARVKVNAARRRADPTLREKDRIAACEGARRKRAALKAARVPITKEEKLRLRLVTDPDFAAQQQAIAERRLADCSARARTRYEDPEYRQAALSREAERRRADPAHFIYVSAKARAKRKGVIFTIEESDIATCSAACPICGIAMAVSDFRWAGNSYTLDRIDPLRGYVPGNVAVICFNCNAVKNNGTAELHERIAAYMRKGR